MIDSAWEVAGMAAEGGRILDPPRLDLDMAADIRRGGCNYKTLVIWVLTVPTQVSTRLRIPRIGCNDAKIQKKGRQQ